MKLFLTQIPSETLLRVCVSVHCKYTGFWKVNHLSVVCGLVLQTKSALGAFPPFECLGDGLTAPPARAEQLRGGSEANSCSLQDSEVKRKCLVCFALCRVG